MSWIRFICLFYLYWILKFLFHLIFYFTSSIFCLFFHSCIPSGFIFIFYIVFSFLLIFSEFSHFIIEVFIQPNLCSNLCSSFMSFSIFFISFSSFLDGMLAFLFVLWICFTGIFLFWLFFSFSFNNFLWAIFESWLFSVSNLYLKLIFLRF